MACEDHAVINPEFVQLGRRLKDQLASMSEKENPLPLFDSGTDAIGGDYRFARPSRRDQEDPPSASRGVVTYLTCDIALILAEPRSTFIDNDVRQNDDGISDEHAGAEKDIGLHPLNKEEATSIFEVIALSAAMK
jgi:hypothetical protein